MPDATLLEFGLNRFEPNRYSLYFPQSSGEKLLTGPTLHNTDVTFTIWINPSLNSHVLNSENAGIIEGKSNSGGN